MKTPGQQILEQLESMGEDKARAAFHRGEFGSGGTPMHLQAKFWLEDEAAKRVEALEKETLSIARNARSIARRANTIAIIAIVLSAIIAIVQMFKS